MNRPGGLWKPGGRGEGSTLVFREGLERGTSRVGRVAAGVLGLFVNLFGYWDFPSAWESQLESPRPRGNTPVATPLRPRCSWGAASQAFPHGARIEVKHEQKQVWGGPVWQGCGWGRVSEVAPCPQHPWH